MTGRREWPLVAMCLLGATTIATAQAPRPGPSIRRISVSAGVVATGGYDLGDRVAELRRNSSGTPSPFTLFRADSELGRAAGIEARVGYALARLVMIEAGGSFARPQLGVTVTQDAELGANAFAAEDVAQFVVEVGTVVQLPVRTWGRRASPYVSGGIGYLRQLHDDRLMVETGRTLSLGAGLRYALRGVSRMERPIGVRVEARYVRRTGGIDFEDRSRGYPVLSVLGFMGF